MARRDVVGHAEMAGRDGPPLLGETGVFEGNASTLDHAPNGAFGNPVWLGSARNGNVRFPAEFACRCTEFGSTVGVETLDELVAHEGKESFLRVLH